MNEDVFPERFLEEKEDNDALVTLQHNEILFLMELGLEPQLLWSVTQHFNLWKTNLKN